MEKSLDRRSRSLWMDIDVAPNARPLQGDKECDVAVIGSGIAGISTAYELAIEGQRVVMVDRGKIAPGGGYRSARRDSTTRSDQLRFSSSGRLSISGS